MASLRKARTLLFTMAILCLALTPVSCGKKDASETSGPIYIGTISPLTGEAALYGQKLTQAVDLAFKEFNDAGGLNGRKVLAIHEDSKLDPQTAVNAARKLIDVNKVDAIIGAVASSATLAVAPVAERAQKILITPISSAAKISDAGEYIFRIAPSDAILAEEAAKWILEEGYGKAAVIYINNDYGSGLAQAFTEGVERGRAEVVSSEGYNPNTTDFRTYLSKIKSSNAEVIFVAAYIEDSGRILRQRAELDIQIPVFGTDPMHDPNLFNLAGEAANGVRFLDVQLYLGPEFENFSSRFFEYSGIEGDVISAQSYDAAMVVLKTLSAKCPPNPETMREISFAGSSGHLEFNSFGDAVGKSFDRYRIQGSTYIQY